MTGIIAHDTETGRPVLPEVAPELFIEAAFILALRAICADSGERGLEAIVRRAVQHAAAVRRGAANALTPSQPLP